MTISATETGGEEFEIFTEAGELLGLAPRSRVHACGLWHKSAQIFLFDGQGHLYLQRRVANKDVCGGLWDLSVAEHLRPGETYSAAARRGLAEELGVLADVHLEPLGEPFAGRLEQLDLGIRDYELQQTFRALWDGPLHPDPAEVAETRRTTLADLATWLKRSPEQFTPWFRRDVVRCGINDSAMGRA